MVTRTSAGAGLLGASFAVLMLTIPLGAAAQNATIEGLISAKHGDQLTIQNRATGLTSVVTVTPQTKVTSTSGALGLTKTDMSVSDLMNGLPVSIDATQNGSELIANSVKFKSGDYKTAQQVHAGTAQAKAELAAKDAEITARQNQLRANLAQAGQYVEKASTTVYFDTGSSKISAKGQQDLQAIATKAHSIDGYFIAVVGYADPRGNAEANQRLSAKRALAVNQYLQKYGGVQPARVLAPDAMGDAHLISDTSTAEGLAQNRRVVVKVVVNKALEALKQDQAQASTAAGAATSGAPQ
jgi:outer membrane protein OmpA-like peptidoglycan-associated protein